MLLKENQNATIKKFATGLWYAGLFALIGLLLLSFVSTDKEIVRGALRWGQLFVWPFMIYSFVLKRIFGGDIIGLGIVDSKQDKV